MLNQLRYSSQCLKNNPKLSTILFASSLVRLLLWRVLAATSLWKALAVRFCGVLGNQKKHGQELPPPLAGFDPRTWGA